MLTLEQIADRLRDRNITKVSEGTNLNRSLLADFRDGKAKNPQYNTIKKLSDYLEAN